MKSAGKKCTDGRKPLECERNAQDLQSHLVTLEQKAQCWAEDLEINQCGMVGVSPSVLPSGGHLLEREKSGTASSRHVGLCPPHAVPANSWALLPTWDSSNEALSQPCWDFPRASLKSESFPSPFPFPDVRPASHSEVSPCLPLSSPSIFPQAFLPKNLSFFKYHLHVYFLEDPNEHKSKTGLEAPGKDPSRRQNYLNTEYVHFIEQY